MAQNLASLFAPPSGAEAAAGAEAQLRKQKAETARRSVRQPEPAGFRPPQHRHRATTTRRKGFLRAEPEQRDDAAWAGRQRQHRALWRRPERDIERRGQDLDAQTLIANNANTVRGSAIAQLFGPLSQGQVSRRRQIWPARSGCGCAVRRRRAEAGHGKRMDRRSRTSG